MDDLIKGWPDRCTLCGKRYGQAKTDIVTVPRGLSVAVTVCLSCIKQDPQQTALRVLLHQRYAGEKTT